MVLLNQDFATCWERAVPPVHAYMSGKVVPSAALLVRMRRVIARDRSRDVG